MKKELNRFINSKVNFGEIDLFREFSNILSKKYITTFIEETHQQYVSFNSLNNCQIKREISDLWIIAYSKKTKKARMTFLQAKFEKKNRNTSIPFRFKGDYFQYELLANRPIINSKNKFNFPADILSSALSDSVGSFGIFYYDARSRINFAYSIAKYLNFNGATHCKTKTKTLYFINSRNHETIVQINRHKELDLLLTLEADSFECFLVNLMIGTPIDSNKKLLIFLRHYFQNINGTNLTDFQNFLNQIIDIDNIQDDQDYDLNNNSNPNILLINIDT
ncbi:hypothetical protein LFX15_18760 [Leptospira levettii]|uniref:hypothetical protein n=1 Tax=Leptospira levettii TaxID=2023178 RepID=UPI001EECE7C9|nr:hypothetical protein [Leptospira levettii]MCG6150345.1 hypothetical protein [Leptospira levettii]